MSGERISFRGLPALERVVDALDTVVAQQGTRHFVLAGGLAVLARLGAFVRVTNDMDTVSAQGDELIEFVEQLDEAGEVEGHLAVDGVRFDVLGVESSATWEDIAQVADEDARLFVAGHLWSLEEATPLTLVTATTRVTLPVASVRSLLVMKLGAYHSARRSPNKRLSDALDVYLLVERCVRDRLFEAPVPAVVAEVAVSALRRLEAGEADLRRRITLGGWADEVRLEALPVLVEDLVTDLRTHTAR